MRNERFERRSFAPVKVGQELDVKIEAVGEKGDGVAKVNGFVLFVPGTSAGQEVHVKVTRVLKRVGFAEVLGKKEEGAAASEEEDSSDEEEQVAEEPASDSEDFGEDNSGDE